MLVKIVSGGQTGADVAALDMALRLRSAGSRESEEPGINRSVVQDPEYAFFWSENHRGMLGGPGEG
jgi:hypothetical protein